MLARQHAVSGIDYTPAPSERRMLIKSQSSVEVSVFTRKPPHPIAPLIGKKLWRRQECKVDDCALVNVVLTLTEIGNPCSGPMTLPSFPKYSSNCCACLMPSSRKKSTRHAVS